MPRCSYCKENYGIPKGMTLVKTDGTIVHLCSSKCRKNMLMKRRKVRWISKTKKTPKGVSSALENVNAEGKKAPAKEEVEGKKKEEKVEKKTPLGVPQKPELGGKKDSEEKKEKSEK